MSTRTLLILFIVLIIVAAAAFLVNRRAEAPEPEPTPVTQTESVQFLEGVTMDAVIRLEVRDEVQDITLALRREEDGNWFQTQPTTTQAISQTVNNSVSGLLNLTSRRTLSADENPLSAYGLDQPLYTIALSARNEAGDTVRYVFLVGNPAPTGSATYVQKEGDPRVYIVPSFNVDNLVELLTEPPIPSPTAPITGTLPITP